MCELVRKSLTGDLVVYEYYPQSEGQRKGNCGLISLNIRTGVIKLEKKASFSANCISDPYAYEAAVAIRWMHKRGEYKRSLFFTCGH